MPAPLTSEDHAGRAVLARWSRRHTSVHPKNLLSKHAATSVTPESAVAPHGFGEASRESARVVLAVAPAIGSATGSAASTRDQPPDATRVQHGDPRMRVRLLRRPAGAQLGALGLRRDDHPSGFL